VTDDQSWAAQRQGVENGSGGSLRLKDLVGAMWKD
jgi:hypothetical protein